MEGDGMETLKKYCRHPECREAIIFMKMKSGKMMAVNWNSLDPDERTSAMMGIPIPYMRLNETGTDYKHISHHATCKHELKIRNQKSLFNHK